MNQNLIKKQIFHTKKKLEHILICAQQEMWMKKMNIEENVH